MNPVNSPFPFNRLPLELLSMVLDNVFWPCHYHSFTDPGCSCQLGQYMIEEVCSMRLVCRTWNAHMMLLIPRFLETHLPITVGYYQRAEQALLDFDEAAHAFETVRSLGRDHGYVNLTQTQYIECMDAARAMWDIANGAKVNDPIFNARLRTWRVKLLVKNAQEAEVNCIDRAHDTLGAQIMSGNMHVLSRLQECEDNKTGTTTEIVQRVHDFNTSIDDQPGWMDAWHVDYKWRYSGRQPLTETLSNS